VRLVGRCVLWAGASYGPGKTVLTFFMTCEELFCTYAMSVSDKICYFLGAGLRLFRINIFVLLRCVFYCTWNFPSVTICRDRVWYDS